MEIYEIMFANPLYILIKSIRKSASPGVSSSHRNTRTDEFEIKRHNGCLLKKSLFFII